MKQVHLNLILQKCDDCPYCEYTEDNPTTGWESHYICKHEDKGIIKLITEKQWHKQKKIVIPKDCPLPEKSK